MHGLFLFNTFIDLVECFGLVWEFVFTILDLVVVEVVLWHWLGSGMLVLVNLFVCNLFDLCLFDDVGEVLVWYGLFLEYFVVEFIEILMIIDVY